MFNLIEKNFFKIYDTKMDKKFKTTNFQLIGDDFYSKKRFHFNLTPYSKEKIMILAPSCLNDWYLFEYKKKDFLNMVENRVSVIKTNSIDHGYINKRFKNFNYFVLSQSDLLKIEPLMFDYLYFLCEFVVFEIKDSIENNSCVKELNKLRFTDVYNCNRWLGKFNWFVNIEYHTSTGLLVEAH